MGGHGAAATRSCKAAAQAPCPHPLLASRLSRPGTRLVVYSVGAAEFVKVRVEAWGN